MHMKAKVRIFTVIGISLIVAVIGTGCAGLVVGGAAGAGAIGYIKGDSLMTYSYPMRETAMAAQRTFADLDISATETTITEIESNLEGTMSDGSQVRIKLTSLSKDLTEVSVRIGLMGNEKGSQRVHEQILNNLQ